MSAKLPAQAAEPRVRPFAPLGSDSTLTSAKRSRRRCALGAFVVTTTVAPVSLISTAELRYVGIAPDGITVYAYTFVILGLLVVALRHGRLLILPALALLPFVVAVLWLSLIEWSDSTRVLSGLLHLATVVAAYLGAVLIALWYEGSKDDFAAMMCGAVFVQAAFVVFELLGIYRRSLAGPQEAELAGRVIGLADHPNQLARLMFVGIVFALVLVGRAERWRRLGAATVPVAMACIALTQSRTAFIASSLLLVLFFSYTFFIGRHRVLGVSLLAVAGGVVLPQLPAIIERFELDPTGGARPYLNEVAEYSIGRQPWTGVGVNEYVNTVGALDLLTASGVPVHNIFLLSTAELGLVAAIALWAPFAPAALVAVKRVRSRRSEAVPAQVFLAALPPLVLLGLTNWGLMQGSMFVVLALTTGFLVGAMLPRNAVSHLEIHQ